MNGGNDERKIILVISLNKSLSTFCEKKKSNHCRTKLDRRDVVRRAIGISERPLLWMYLERSIKQVGGSYKSKLMALSIDHHGGILMAILRCCDHCRRVWCRSIGTYSC